MFVFTCCFKWARKIVHLKRKYDMYLTRVHAHHFLSHCPQSRPFSRILASKTPLGVSYKDRAVMIVHLKKHSCQTFVHMTTSSLKALMHGYVIHFTNEPRLHENLATNDPTSVQPENHVISPKIDK